MGLYQFIPFTTFVFAQGIAHRPPTDMIASSLSGAGADLGIFSGQTDFIAKLLELCDWKEGNERRYSFAVLRWLC